MNLVFWLIASLILIVPVWRIFSRAALPAWWSLLIFVPGLGYLAILIILAFARWPSTQEARESPPQSATSPDPPGGFSGWWCLATLVPLLNIVMIWVFAYAKWPAQRPTPPASAPASAPD